MTVKKFGERKPRNLFNDFLWKKRHLWSLLFLKFHQIWVKSKNLKVSMLEIWRRIWFVLDLMTNLGFVCFDTPCMRGLELIFCSLPIKFYEGFDEWLEFLSWVLIWNALLFFLPFSGRRRPNGSEFYFFFLITSYQGIDNSCMKDSYIIMLFFFLPIFVQFAVGFEKC